MRDTEALAAWRTIVGLVKEGLEGVSDEDLDWRPPDSAMTIREIAHHIVEANVVAASIVVAALGSPGCVYDWSWMLPFGPWMDRVAYHSKPLPPSLGLLEALNAWVAAQIEPLPDGLEREVQLRDAPDAALRRATVADVLRQEAEHAAGHRRDIDRIRARAV